MITKDFVEWIPTSKPSGICIVLALYRDRQPNRNSTMSPTSCFGQISQSSPWPRAHDRCRPIHLLAQSSQEHYQHLQRLYPIHLKPSSRFASSKPLPDLTSANEELRLDCAGHYLTEKETWCTFWSQSTAFQNILRSCWPVPQAHKKSSNFFLPISIS